MIYIDGSNFYHGLKEAVGRPRIDYAKFAASLCGQRRLIHVHYYNIPLRQSDGEVAYAGQQRFLAQLRRVPHLTIRLGRFVDRTREENCPQCGHRYSVAYQTEKGVDVQLATDLLTGAFDNQFDAAVVVSHDGDFAPVVSEVRRLGKRVENAEFPHRLPSYLASRCSGVIQLTAELLSQSTF